MVGDVTLEIRGTNAVELPVLAGLLVAVKGALLEAGIDQWDDVYPTLDDFRCDVARGELFVALRAGVVAGAMAVNEEQDPAYATIPWSFEGPRVAVVHRLMVDPRASGRGVARALMVHAECVARKRGCAAIRLDAFANNPRALRLYDSLGYRRAGEVTFRKGRFVCFERAL